MFGLPLWAAVGLTIFWVAVLVTVGLLIARKLKGTPPSRPVDIPHAHELNRHGDLRLLRQPGGGGGGG